MFWSKKNVVELTEDEIYQNYVGSEQYFEDGDFEQSIKDGHAKIYGDNRLGSVDISATLNELIKQHVSAFHSGAKFPPQYKHFLNAANEEGYEVARFESVFGCRKAMIESRRYLTNDYEKFGRGQNGEIISLKQISREGLDVLAMCEAYDIYERETRITNNSDYLADYYSKRKYKKKMYEREPIVVNSGNADVKRAELGIALANFENSTRGADDTPDLIDGFKRLFGF